ncbi:NupC/NupG family nucleoside CNT transporter [Acidisphaera rubrifaciens]|uniref:Nucleoside permease n=1 Tax=Acidisphaera rubrifaciens HS-AP3 TaxID=1231350 RepID=A0A0D6P517_9PROT|nr:nucleoside transporter C-terminal domain-containing protein [Acidisphaera rubrifaciens]GAN76742.1 nucleoside permease [Acidisphaera rubrifaciens HS-AP3]
MRGLIALPALLALAWVFGRVAGEHRGGVRLRPVIGGTALQIALGAVLIGIPAARHAVGLLNDAATALQDATDAGTAFVFGYLGGSALPFAETHPGAAFILAFKALPLVLVISALSALLFHWGILQRIAGAFAWALRRTLGIGGALAIAAAVHVFVGMIEAPLLIRPWLARMSRGELFAVMSCGMAGIAGTVMVIYAAILGPVIPDALGNILIASVISTPAALAMSALMVPYGPGEADAALVTETPAAGALDALVRGTLDGMRPLVAIAALLLVTVALVTLFNGALGRLPLPPGWPRTLQDWFALPARPLVWLIGLDWAESAAGATLLGTKTVLNEFVAYLRLAALPPGTLSPHARLIMTYALCGFANFGSLGILVGGMGAMVPERRAEIVALGLRSLVSGTLATLSSGALAGALAAG